MESIITRTSPPPDKLLSVSRIVTLFGSVLVTLSSGTNYIYSAYAPQLGARLQVSHTQLNIIGLAGNAGVSISGPVLGRIVDCKGPRILLICASICLLVGYLGMRQMYDDGMDNGTTISVLHLILLVVYSFMTGLGGCAGCLAAANTTAKSFPSSVRATTTGLVMSGFGLSAFWFSLLAHILYPGDTSGLLLTLGVGTAIPMLLGLFIVKPVPLLPASSNEQHEITIEGYDPVLSNDDVIFGDPQVVDLVSARVDTESTPLLSPEPVQTSSNHEIIIRNKDELQDIRGKQLWVTPDFFLVFTIIGVCGGTGCMYINNVGSIARALYAQTHAVYNDVEAIKWQVAQVSILSLANCTGRILVGLISDFAYTHLHLPRAYCLCMVSSLLIISQLITLTISSVETLWMATFLFGLAYGFCFGISPTIMVEWFGLAHYSENVGYLSLSPLIGGYLFSLVFGYNMDSHVQASSVDYSLVRPLTSMVLSDFPPKHQCLDGRACYSGSLRVTLVACIISLGLSWWAGIREGRMIQRKTAHRA